MADRSLAAALLLALASCTVTDRGVDLGARKFGLGLGNSHELTGLRLSLRDVDVRSGNGINLGLLPPGPNDGAVLNGLNLGLLQTNADTQNGINVSSFLTGKDLHGINLGLLGAIGERDLAGLNGAPFLLGGSDIKGLNLGLLSILQREAAGAGAERPPALQGISLSGLLTRYADVDGLALGGLLDCDRLTGIAASYLANQSDGATRGLAIAPFNRAAVLHGVQVGLLNYVESHPHPFKVLPLLNVGFGGPVDGDGAPSGP